MARYLCLNPRCQRVNPEGFRWDDPAGVLDVPAVGRTSLPECPLCARIDVQEIEQEVRYVFRPGVVQLRIPVVLAEDGGERLAKDMISLLEDGMLYAFRRPLERAGVDLSIEATIYEGAIVGDGNAAGSDDRRVYGQGLADSSNGPD